MILELNLSGDTPIYQQIRNQIILGIGKGLLVKGERLPTVRQLAEDVGVNTMTINKAYAMLKEEGYIAIDRRHGAEVQPSARWEERFRFQFEGALSLLAAECRIRGMEKQAFLERCEQVYSQMQYVPKEESACGAP